MKWIAEFNGSTKLHFVIEQKIYINAKTKEKLPQYKIYIYINGVDTYDYLLDSLKLAK